MATEQTFPENNLITTQDFKYPITIDVVNRFKEDLTKMMELLGVTRKISVNEGMILRSYTNYDVELEDGDVPEGEIIPLSKVKRKPYSEQEIKLKKYRKAVTGEDIQMFGADEAINNTDMALISQLQKQVRKDFVDNLKSGKGEQEAKGVGLQGALAGAWGSLQTLFEDYGTPNTIAFVNPQDVAAYIGQAGITTQTAFGLTFLTGFTNTTVILSSDVAEGEIWATVSENINLAYINPSTSALAREFNLTADPTGYIGMNHFKHNESLTVQTLIVSGILLFIERVDGVVKVKIKEPETTTTPSPSNPGGGTDPEI